MNKLEELARSNEELEAFAYIASHDLQEPLRMVSSYTELLSRRYKGQLDDDADEFIAFAVDGANRMQRLIQDLLAFSRVGTKGRSCSRPPSEDAFLQALANLRGAIEDSGAVVTHDPLPARHGGRDATDPAVPEPDRQRDQVSAPRQSRESMSRPSRTARSRWRFSVKDNGLGIDPEYFERIFGMFQRLHKRDEFAGTGIGLAICKKIVERHGGTISSSRNPGRDPRSGSPWEGGGARMNADRRTTVCRSTCSWSRTARATCGSRGRPSTRRTASIHLSVVADGVEAMSFLKRGGPSRRRPRPDLILLDLNLPKMDGREVLSQIKDDDELKTIPTIILTTSEAEADIAMSYQLQANSYLCKPVQLDKFESLVTSINDFWLTKAKLPQRQMNERSHRNARCWTGGWVSIRAPGAARRGQPR